MVKEVFNVLLFVEGSGSVVTHTAGPSLADGWNTFTGTYTIDAGVDVSGGLSLLIESVCGGAAGCSVCQYR